MPGPLIDTATSFPSGAKCQLSHVLLNDLGLSVFKGILSNISSSFLLEPRNLVLLIYRSTPDRPTWFAAIPLAALGSDLQTSGFCNCCAVQPGKAWFRTGKIPSVFVHIITLTWHFRMQLHMSHLFTKLQKKISFPNKTPPFISSNTCICRLPHRYTPHGSFIGRSFFYASRRRPRLWPGR